MTFSWDMTQSTKPNAASAGKQHKLQHIQMSVSTTKSALPIPWLRQIKGTSPLKTGPLQQAEKIKKYLKFQICDFALKLCPFDFKLEA